METQSFVSIAPWTLIFQITNLLRLMLLFKKFLFKPVQAMMKSRQDQVEKIYTEADENLGTAKQLKQEYEQKMASARQEADTLIKTATQTAQRKSDQIVSEANSQATHVKQKAEEEIAQQKKQMLRDVRSEISELAVDIASKVVEREINQKDYDGFVDEFIQNVGERQ